VIPSRLQDPPQAADGLTSSGRKTSTGSLSPLRHPFAWGSRYGGMIRELAVTDFKLKYQGSVLGYLWSFAKPLMLFAVLYFVFTRFVPAGARVPHYGHYLLLGIVLWTYFVDGTLVGMVSIVDRSDLIRKVYFPRIVIPVASSITALITLGLNLVIIFAFILIAGIGLRPTLPLFVLVLLELYVLTLGCSLLLAALFVRFRDFRHIWEVVLQVLFYATPIIYPLSLVPKRVAPLLALSPMAQIVEDARKVLITPETMTVTQLLPLPLSLFPYLVPVVLVVVGYWYFQSTASKFAEQL